MPATIPCEYCHASNPKSETLCIACGAPLPEFKEIRPAKIKKSPTVSASQPDKTVETAHKVALAYGYFWMTIIEALIIAAVGSGIGFIGALIGHPVIGTICGLLFGLSVGWTIKSPLATLFSAPLGLLFGSFLSVLASFLHAAPIIYLILLTICASSAALIGGLRIPMRFRSRWHKIRPFLGAAGGWTFGFLGSLLGAGAHLITKSWF